MSALYRVASAVVLAVSLMVWPASAAQNTLTTPSSPLTMAGLAAFLNNALATVATNYSGATPPAVCTGGMACTYQFWLDTSTSPRVLRLYDGASWVYAGAIDTAAHTFSFPPTEGVNAQTGTTYAIPDTARGQLITQSNASASAYSIIQAGTVSSFIAGWWADVVNNGAGTLTVTPVVSTINGLSSLAIKQGRGARIVSDGTNYQAYGFSPLLDTGSGPAVLQTSPTILDDLTVPMVVGGTAVGSSLTLQSTSNGSPTTDYLLLKGGASLATPALVYTPTAGRLAASTRIDHYGNLFITGGTPNAATPGGGYDCLNPFFIPQQPTGSPPSTILNLCTTAGAISGVNSLSSTIYSLGANTDGHYAGVFSAVSDSTSSGAGGLSATYLRINPSTAFGHAFVAQVATNAVSTGSGEIGAIQAIVAQSGATPRNVEYLYELKSAGASLGANIGVRLQGNSVIASTGTVLGLFTGTRISAANGIDFEPNAGVTDATFSGFAFRSPGFSASGTGVVKAASYSIGANSFASASGNYHQILAPGVATARLTLGNATDPINYYDNDGHFFRNAAATTTYGTIGSSGFTIGNAGSTLGILRLAGNTSGNSSISPSAAASGVWALPNATDTIVGKATTDTFTNKTFDTAGTGNSFSINGVAVTANSGTGAVTRATAPTIAGGSHTAITSLGLRNAGTGAFDLTLAMNGTLTAGRTITFDPGDAARSVTLGGNITTGGTLTTAAALTQAGAFATTITTTATTNSTLPAGTHTLAGLDVAQTFTAVQTVNILDAATATPTTIATLGHDSSGTAASLFGARLKYTLQSSTTAGQDAGAIDVSWLTATHATRTSWFNFYLVNSASALTNVARFNWSGNDGAIGLYSANLGTISSSAFSISGNYVAFNSPGSGSDNISIFVGGNTSDPSSYYNNTTHNMRSRDGGTIFQKINSSGTTLTALSADTASVDATVCARTSDNLLLKGTGALGICLGTSGRQFKTALTPMKAGLDDLMKIDFVNYRYKPGYGDGGERLQYGTTAQNVERAIPDLARHDARGETINFDSGALLFVGLRAIQELKASNDNLRTEVESLRLANRLR